MNESSDNKMNVNQNINVCPNMDQVIVKRILRNIRDSRPLIIEHKYNEDQNKEIMCCFTAFESIIEEEITQTLGKYIKDIIQEYICQINNLKKEVEQNKEKIYDAEKKKDEILNIHENLKTENRLIIESLKNKNLHLEQNINDIVTKNTESVKSLYKTEIEDLKKINNLMMNEMRSKYEKEIDEIKDKFTSELKIKDEHIEKLEKKKKDLNLEITNLNQHILRANSNRGNSLDKIVELEDKLNKINSELEHERKKSNEKNIIIEQLERNIERGNYSFNQQINSDILSSINNGISQLLEFVNREEQRNLSYYLSQIRQFFDHKVLYIILIFVVIVNLIK